MRKNENGESNETKEKNGVEDNKENESEKPAEIKPAVDDLFAKFMKPKVSGSWVCDVCMISNPAEAMKCVACESPRPGAPAAPAAPPEPGPAAAPVDDLFAKFMKPKVHGEIFC